jgi:hypothetical protein
MVNDLFVSIVLSRADGTAVLKMGGNATAPVIWRAPTDDSSSIAASGKWLDAFEYIPCTREREGEPEHDRASPSTAAHLLIESFVEWAAEEDLKGESRYVEPHDEDWPQGDGWVCLDANFDLGAIAEKFLTKCALPKPSPVVGTPEQCPKCGVSFARWCLGRECVSDPDPWHMGDRCPVGTVYKDPKWHAKDCPARICPACKGKKGRKRVCLICKGTGSM